MNQPSDPELKRFKDELEKALSSNPNNLEVIETPPAPQFSTLEYKSDMWHTVKVVFCTAIVFAFLSYLAYLTRP
jgi:predicted secreted protein